ncbi:MAG TPA: pyruvate ferredoxin oxidoreductase [Thermodesulfobacteriaceae bacterium]|nr:pyruvate ferredoxin oxidoreductase [Thermodesulfobacteriaceae bacterium]
MKSMRILFTGVGGQGTLLASRLLGEAAMAQGMEVKISEVHGMAQRGGVVESTVMLGGIESPIISEGQANIMVSFEPLETLRALNRCNRDTAIITNITPVIPFTVKLGQSEYPDISQWMDFVSTQFKMVYAFDAESLAREAGTSKAVNIVLLGTLIGTGRVPISADIIENTIREKVKPGFVDANLKAFELGLQQA